MSKHQIEKTMTIGISRFRTYSYRNQQVTGERRKDQNKTHVIGCFEH